MFLKHTDTAAHTSRVSPTTEASWPCSSTSVNPLTPFSPSYTHTRPRVSKLTSSPWDPRARKSCPNTQSKRILATLLVLSLFVFRFFPSELRTSFLTPVE